MRIITSFKHKKKRLDYALNGISQTNMKRQKTFTNYHKHVARSENVIIAKFRAVKTKGSWLDFGQQGRE
jgi:hypothetical protein